VNGAGEWLKNHLWQIVTFALTLLSGALIGHQTNVMKIEYLERQDTRLEKRMDDMQAEFRQKMTGRHDFMNDAASRVNFMCQESPDCRELYPALQVPE
jgi:hypothetical protein